MLADDFYKHEWFSNATREYRKRVADKIGKVARVTVEDMVRYTRFYPGGYRDGTVEIRFNDRTFLQVHENMLEPIAKPIDPHERLWKACGWIGEHFSQLPEKDYNGLVIFSDPNTRETTVIVNERIGRAKCSPSDEFNSQVGIMIAMSRALGQGYPDWV